MSSKAILAEIKKLEGKLHNNLLQERAKSNDFNRVFIGWDEKVHLMEEPSDTSLYYYYQFLCEEDTVSDPDGILQDSAIILTKGSPDFMSKYHQYKLCPKCFKYVKPSDILRLEATKKRQKGKAILSEAGEDNTYLLGKAEELECAARGLDNGSIKLHLVEIKE